MHGISCRALTVRQPWCAGTKHSNQYKMWYFFSLQGGNVGETVHMRIVDMNSVVKVYNGDLRPLVRVTSVSEHWERYVVSNVCGHWR